MLEELKDIPTFKIDWEDKTEVKVNAVQCKYVGATVKKVINDFLEGKVFGNAHFFVNSVEFIATMIKNCNLTNENTRIIFSKNNETYKHTCQGVTNGETTDPVKKINFILPPVLKAVIYLIQKVKFILSLKVVKRKP